jgi:hypothetical protein
VNVGVCSPETLSAAEKTLHFLESDPTCSYIALYAEWGTALLSIPRQKPRLTQVKRFRGGNESEQSTIGSNEANLFWNEVVPLDQSLSDEVDSAEDQAMRIRNALKITGTGKILLAIAWTTDNARLMLRKFPEATATDITKGTNKEKRPMFLMVCKNAENQTSPVTWGIPGLGMSLDISLDF